MLCFFGILPRVEMMKVFGRMPDFLTISQDTGILFAEVSP